MEVAPKNNRNHLGNVDSSPQLVEQASAGCSDSFRQLIEQNHRRVRLYLGKYVQCSAEIDDIAQEVFLVAFGQLGNFRREAKFSTWLLGIARNKALEFLREESKGRKGRKQFFEAEIANRQISRLENGAQSDIEDGRISAMQVCLQQLPDQSRELINQHYFKRQTAIDIADQSNVSAGSIRMRLLRIRQILQKCIVARSEAPDDKQSMTEFGNE
jgi:RNA polymerase sigma-70 factor (ECF subfamily)